MHCFLSFATSHGVIFRLSLVFQNLVILALLRFFCRHPYIAFAFLCLCFLATSKLLVILSSIICSVCLGHFNRLSEFLFLNY